jgi:hypothetical protein
MVCLSFLDVGEAKDFGWWKMNDGFSSRTAGWALGWRWKPAISSFWN